MRQFALVGLLLLIRGVALPCDCTYIAPCQRVNHTEVIFLGRVLDAGPTGEGPFLFLVEEAFKGAKPNTEVEIQPGPCEATYARGGRYLVLANRWPDRKLEAGGCSGTTPADLAADDIRFFRDWAQGRRTLEVRGRIAENVDDGFVRYAIEVDHRPGLPGVEVTVTRNGHSYRAITDSDGSFHVSVPSPGDYRMTATFAGHASSESQYDLTLEPRSCAELNVGMWTDNHVSGRVLDPAGQAVAGLRVELAPFSREVAFPMATKTNSNGEFEFTKVPAGDYVLGVNVGGLSSKLPYEPRFYPGVAERKDATPVHVGRPGAVASLDFKVGNPVPTRQIAVSVVWPDHRPVTNASVTCESDKSSDRFNRDSISKYTDQEGKAVCEVLADRDYRVYANRLSWSGSSRPVQPIATRPKAFVAAGDSAAYAQIVVDNVNDISGRETPLNMSRFNNQQDQ